jgi:hypothetical protein
MNSKQTSALKELEAAFKKCKAAKLAFFGMDGGILAFDAEYIDSALSRPNSDLCSLQSDDNEEFNDRSVNVNTHRTYRDSGGF